MKTASLIVFASFVLSACAGLGQQPVAPADTSVNAAPAHPISAPAVSKSAALKSPVTLAEETTAANPAAEALPAVKLTPQLMYQLLASEIAFQRGDWQAAYVTLLADAQKTRDPRIARRAAEIGLAAKQPREALAAVRLWRQISPDSEEATQYFLGLLMLGDNLAEAQPLFEQRLQSVRPPLRGLMLLQIQRVLARAKNKKAALAMLEKLTAPYLTLPEAHLALAQSYFLNEESAKAMSEAQLALKAEPDSELAALTLAQVTPDKEKSAAVIADFLRTHPASREVRLAYGRMLVEQKQFAVAQREFEAMLKNQPNDVTALYALGILNAQNNDLKNAEIYLTRYINALAAQPDEERDPSQALLLLAQIADERNDPEAALAWLSKIESGDAFLNAQIKRAQLIAKRGDVAGAQKILASLQAGSEREQAQLIAAEGQILRDAKQLPAALAVLESGVKRFPANPDLLYDYAMMAEKADQFDAMETALRKVIEIVPENQHAYNALGYSLAERNLRLPEALMLISKAAALAPEDPFIMDSLGWVQFRLGKLKEAEQLLRRAYTLRPDPEIAVHLGEVLWVIGQKDDAQKFWRDAKGKDPKNDTLRMTLARLHVKL